MNASRAPLCLALCLVAGGLAAQDDNVRVYRCVGSNGAVALQDSPCRSGQQQVRELQRPRDPPPRAASSAGPAAAPAAAAPPREVRYVQVQPPQPMYECVNADGGRYVSDSNEGNPRWVSVWAGGGWPVRGGGWHGGGPRPPRPPSGPRPGDGDGFRPPPDRGGPGGPRPPRGPQYYYGGVPAGSVLVRDTCTALPPQEVCARVRDRRWELDRRYNSALQSEREAIVREQRGLDARLAQDCDGR